MKKIYLRVSKLAISLRNYSFLLSINTLSCIYIYPSIITLLFIYSSTSFGLDMKSISTKQRNKPNLKTFFSSPLYPNIFVWGRFALFFRKQNAACFFFFDNMIEASIKLYMKLDYHTTRKRESYPPPWGHVGRPAEYHIF